MTHQAMVRGLGPGGLPTLTLGIILLSHSSSESVAPAASSSAPRVLDSSSGAEHRTFALGVESQPAVVIVTDQDATVADVALQRLLSGGSGSNTIVLVDAHATSQQSNALVEASLFDSLALDGLITDIRELRVAPASPTLRALAERVVNSRTEGPSTEAAVAQWARDLAGMVSHADD